MLEHAPWVGPNYPGSGINGQRICTVGYSHHLDNSDLDREDFTKYVIGHVISDTPEPNSFFSPISGYFGVPDSATSSTHIRRKFNHRTIVFSIYPQPPQPYCFCATSTREYLPLSLGDERDNLPKGQSKGI